MNTGTVLRKKMDKQVIKIAIVGIFFVLNSVANLDLTLSALGDNALMEGFSFIGDSGVYMQGRSSGLGGKNDNCLFAYKNVRGNCEFGVNDLHILDTDSGVDAGLMIRSDTTSGGLVVAIAASQVYGCFISYRSQISGKMITNLVSDSLPSSVKIIRSGNWLSFYYKTRQTDSAYTKVPGTLIIAFPPVVCAGLFQTSNGSNSGTVSYGGVSGLSVVEIQDTTNCINTVYDFEQPFDFTSSGFSHNGFWVYDSAGFLQSNALGGYDSAAELTTPNLTASRSVCPVIFKWDVRFSDINCNGINGNIKQYVLFGSQNLNLGAYSWVKASLLGSNGTLTIGENTSNFEADIMAQGDVTLCDGVYLDGDITTAGIVHSGSGGIIYGTILVNAEFATPVIIQKTVSIGTVDVNVGANETKTLAPGYYKDVYVGSNAHIYLSAGVYNFKTFVTADRAGIWFNVSGEDSVEINVRDNFYFDYFTQMLYEGKQNIYDNNGDCEVVSIYTHQTGVMSMGESVTLSGFLYAPRATLTIGEKTKLYGGGIYANSLNIAGNATIIKNGSINSSDSSSYVYDKMTLNFKNAVDSTEQYTLQYIPKCEDSTQNIADLILIHNNEVLKSVSTHVITPVQEWLRFRAEFYPVLSEADSSSVKVYYDFGNGYVNFIDTVHDAITSFSPVDICYKTGRSPFANTMQFDNFSILCEKDTCNEIVILNQPHDTGVYENQNVIFYVKTVDGNKNDYQWLKNNTAISGANGDTLFLYGVVYPGDSGSIYRCKITNSCDTLNTRNASLHIKQCVEPVIVQQPVHCTTAVGAQASFSVVASGYGLSYQWFKNSQIVTGYTNSTLQINAVAQYQHEEMYRLKVSNDCGKFVFSDNAMIIIDNSISSCAIIHEPENDTIEEGEYFFTYIAVDCPQGEFIWLKNNNPIAGSDDTLIVGPLSLSDNGTEYKCIVENNNNADTSLPAYVYVIPQKSGNRVVAISGEMTNWEGLPVGADSVEMLNFKVDLFESKYGGKSIYSEFFDVRGIPVDSGQFTLMLGRGRSKEDLQFVAASHNSLYAELRAWKDGYKQLLGSRLALTAAPYGFSSGVKVIYGNGSPVVNLTECPVGVLYVDKGDNNATWKKASSGWIKLD